MNCSNCYINSSFNAFEVPNGQILFGSLGYEQARKPESFCPPSQQQMYPSMLSQMPAVMSVNDDNKYRQLPCRTFIAVGTCPFRDRCVYLHDPRLLCKEAKTKTRKKNRDDTVTDSLFWPVMHRLDVRQRLDPILQGNSRILQPHVIQPYHVPIPFDSLARGQTVPNAVLATHTGSNRAGTGFGTFHDRCLYSLWMHFTDYCMTQNGTAETDGSSASVGAGIGTSTCSLNQGRSDTSTHSRSNPRNKYLGTFRLPFFVALAGSESTSISQKENHGTPQQLIYEEEEIISDDEDSDLQHNPLPQGLSRAPSAPPGCAHEEPGSSSVSPTSILEGMWYLENAAASAASIVEVDKMILSCGKPPGLLSSHEEPQLSSLLLTTPALVSSDVRHCSSYYSSSVHSPSRQLHSPPNLSPNRAPPTHLSGYFNRQQPSRSDPNICRYQAHYEQCSYY